MNNLMRAYIREEYKKLTNYVNLYVDVETDSVSISNINIKDRTYELTFNGTDGTDLTHRLYTPKVPFEYDIEEDEQGQYVGSVFSHAEDIKSFADSEAIILNIQEEIRSVIEAELEKSNEQRDLSEIKEER